jgi:hypothetical protein
MGTYVTKRDSTYVVQITGMRGQVYGVEQNLQNLEVTYVCWTTGPDGPQHSRSRARCIKNKLTFTCLHRHKPSLACFRARIQKMVVTVPSGTGDAPQWERVLWKPQPFPDNYVPPTFLAALSKNRKQRFFKLSYLKITEH